MALVPRYISRNEILDLHERMLEGYGGMPGVRDEGILDSCLAQPQTHVFDVERFPTFADKAAAYCYFIARNHPFFDGNKRAALMAAQHFLWINGIEAWFEQDEAYDVIIGAATGEVDLEGVATMIAAAVQRAKSRGARESRTDRY